MSRDLQEKIDRFKTNLAEWNFTIEDVVRNSIPHGISLDDVLEEIQFEFVAKPETDKISTEDIGKKRSMSFCRSIGGCIEGESEKNRVVTEVYCLIGFIAMEDIDPTYLQCVVNEYYRLITQWFAEVINMVEWKKGTKISDIIRTLETDISDFYISIPGIFRKYLLTFYGIDIDIIIGISGSYYEKNPCHSGIYFETANSEDRKGKYAIQFKIPSEVCEKNIRQIRKYLEMGNGNQYLVARREKGVWWITGFCFKEDLSEGIAFRIISHMVWYMEMLGRKAVSYKCGKYVIECEEFSQREFSRKYRALFGKDCGEILMGIFKNALKQEHGTIIMILGNSLIKQELERLLKTSTGIEIEESELDEESIHNITAIDGAAVFDEDGRCHAIGVILDSNLDEIVDAEGRMERGARYNSTVKYIKTRKGKNEKALAVIVSEDQIVNIISTIE